MGALVYEPETTFDEPLVVKLSELAADAHAVLHDARAAPMPLAYSALDYRDLLAATRTLTHDEAAVAEMFRRACFNVFAHTATTTAATSLS